MAAPPILAVHGFLGPGVVNVDGEVGGRIAAVQRVSVTLDHGAATIDPQSVERYLKQKFGENLGPVRSAMQGLAKSYDRQTLADVAYSLYERFRPEFPEGKKGWGSKGELDLGLIQRLAT
jgi:hypothetical protein